MNPPDSNATLPAPPRQLERPKHEWLRWIAMPFAAIVGAAAAAVVLPALWWFSTAWMAGWSTDGGCFQYILPCVGSGLFGGCFVAITLEVAPRGKQVAGIVMTTILGVLLLLGLAAILINADGGMGDKIFLSIQVAVCLVSSIITLVNLDNGRA